MKALTIWQPWATLIAEEIKHYETRSWSTGYRGPIAIHAAKRWTHHEVTTMLQLARRFPIVGSALAYDGEIHTPPLGAIVCIGVLVAVHKSEEIRDSLPAVERALGDYRDRRFAWEIAEIQLPIQGPIPAKGQQGLWEWQQ